MTRLDLHPDGLLDLARKGRLNAGERDRLHAHCATCAACRMELAWFEDGMNVAVPSRDDQAVAARAVDALLGVDLAAVPAPPRPRGRGGRRAGLAVCIALLTASAAAALYIEVRERRERESRTEAAAVARDRPAPRQPRGVRLPAVPAVAEPNAAPAPAPGPAPPAVSKPQAKLAQANPPARQPAAERLFALANAERDAGRLARASELYAELAQTYPNTRSELAGRVSHAQVLLQLDQPARARAEFARYLGAQPEGPLAEEARVGLALCARRLGDTREERTAWQNLIDRHPDSLHAARARQRLSELPP